MRHDLESGIRDLISGRTANWWKKEEKIISESLRSSFHLHPGCRANERGDTPPPPAAALGSLSRSVSLNAPAHPGPPRRLTHSA